MKSWKEALLTYSIQPIQQFRYTAGKNATDSSMIIDAMDLLYTEHLDGFCIVSSDSDFTRLSSRIRRAGSTVYGFGEKKTPPPSWAPATSSSTRRSSATWTTGTPLGQEDEQRTEERQPSCQAPPGRVEDSADESGYAILATIGSNIVKRMPEFDPRNYGYKKLGVIIQATQLFQRMERPAKKRAGNPCVLQGQRRRTRRNRARGRRKAEDESAGGGGGKRRRHPGGSSRCIPPQRSRYLFTRSSTSAPSFSLSSFRRLVRSWYRSGAVLSPAPRGELVYGRTCRASQRSSIVRPEGNFFPASRSPMYPMESPDLDGEIELGKAPGSCEPSSCCSAKISLTVCIPFRRRFHVPTSVGRAEEAPGFIVEERRLFTKSPRREISLSQSEYSR
jgi:uncharacterized LabA/DUF88 family protein